MALKELAVLSAAALELQEGDCLAPESLNTGAAGPNVLASWKQNNDALGALATVEKQGRGATRSRLVEVLAQTTSIWKTDEALRFLRCSANEAPKDADVDVDRRQVYVQRAIQAALEVLNKSIEKESQTIHAAYFELGNIRIRRAVGGLQSALLKAVRKDSQTRVPLSS